MINRGCGRAGGALALLLICGAAAGASPEKASTPSVVIVRPAEYRRPLRNPMMGLRGGCDDKHEWSTLTKTYIKWCDIEGRESDGVEKIRDFCDRLWRDGGGWVPVSDMAKGRGVEDFNVKVIPRVYLQWSKEDEVYWPSDLLPNDYASIVFKARLLRLIGRLGRLWDGDPRVAYVEMGFIGKWGEQHSPRIEPAMQKVLGDAFTRAFPHKLVMVRNPWDFSGYRFGVYWDSWAHIQQMSTDGEGIAKPGDRWKFAPMGGETAYDWGEYKTQPGENPTDTMVDPVHRRFLIDSIRRLHCNHLGWVANYDANNADARAGAEEVQLALGYRFVIGEVRYPAQVKPGGKLRVLFTVRNTGSSPFYYNWPVQVSLLDPKTRRPAWSAVFTGIDIRKWLPGEGWNSAKQAYLTPAMQFTVQKDFTLPRDLVGREYVLSLAVLDPAGGLPSVRFSMRNYFAGGQHPLGKVGVGVAVTQPHLDAALFDDPGADRTLHYVVSRR